MARSLYLINPAVDFPTYFGGEVFAQGGRPAAEIVADLSLPTVAAMVPPGIHLEFCNENVTTVDFERPVDVVGLTGKVSQQRRMFAIADEFRRRGKTVLIGGPFASLSPEVVRAHCDVLVQGELEGVAGELFSDLEQGTLRADYAGERPDLSATPVPRWDLYPNERTLMGAVQTSRGCPFECEFCDVIPYVGRKQRTKSVGQILAELDTLYGIGYREVFFADDNFSASRRFAKELLAALAGWNARRAHGRMGFMTELSIDGARDDELLDLIAASGMRKVYMGIETPNLEGLKETRKRQNLVGDLVELVHRFYERGVAVFAGMIVGFDADRAGIFEWQFEFAEASSIPIFTLGTLVAPDRTPLAARMQKEGRLLDRSTSVTAAPWSTNIQPQHMSLDEQLQGMKWLANSLYHPDRFGERVLALLDKLAPLPGAGTVDRSWGGHHIGSLRTDVQIILARVARRGEAEMRMLGRVRKALERRPEATSLIMPMILTYAQVRHMYDQGQFWDPHVRSPQGSAVALSV
ncbi:MAG: radical SAM protein [Planctomycetota bacterium]|nr:MAG: radical SAM protein [Planctomycetota bacterium]